ncbi:MAG: 3-phosphoshikimate 1-carboxyvinyltransferase [Muribaculaceae bacterium]
MNYSITAPERINTTVDLPASKSISNRAMMLTSLCQAPKAINLTNISDCDDSNAMIHALNSNGSDNINIGAAGTAMRFLTAYFAAKEGRQVVLDGSARMRQRPIGTLVNALKKCGANISYLDNDGCPPLRITGTHLKANEIKIPGDVSSQFISALLMISPLIEGCTTLRLTGNIISRPYIEMTLAMMEKFNVKATFSGNTITLPPNPAYSSNGYVIENDWSAASYWFQIKALMPQSNIRLRGLFKDSLQGDSAVAKIFEHFGVTTSWEDNELVLNAKQVTPHLVKLDLSNTPDLAQTVVVTACMLRMPFQITGLQTLRIKETDRINALCVELSKFGITLTATHDSLFFNGKVNDTCDLSCGIDTYCDHRMAMAFAPAAALHPGLVINDAGVVSKSYPRFWDDLKQAQFNITTV